MHVFISGIAGSGLSSLAHLCIDLGYKVSGSDLVQSQIVDSLIARGLNFKTGQTPEFLTEQNLQSPIDYYIYTPALPEHSLEKAQAKFLNLKMGKQNLLINQIIKQKNLKLIAVAGTHGKTTTTAMLVWLFKKLNLPVSYIVGTSIPFGNSGEYQINSEYLVYEADEYDRKFLDLYPDIGLIVSLDYDHPDIYPTQTSYFEAFAQFCQSSRQIISHDLISQLRPFFKLETTSKIPQIISKISNILDSNQIKKITLTGKYNRDNAQLAVFTVCTILSKDKDSETIIKTLSEYNLIEIINQFPGTSRRFEKLLDNLYTDYAHHPSEIRATLQLAREYLKQSTAKLIIVYQPHQNSRQHELIQEYKTCFELADTIYWLPTYFSRENPLLAILSPQELSFEIKPLGKVKVFDLDNVLLEQIKTDLIGENFILLLGAGNIDDWFRSQLGLS